METLKQHRYTSPRPGSPARTQAQSTEAIFKSAREAFNRGQIYKALQTARYALLTSRRNGATNAPYICGFISQIKHLLGQRNLARIYCRLALGSLDPNSDHFREDRRYYRRLLAEIDGSH